MSNGAMIPFATLHFEGDRFGATLMFYNIGCHRGVLPRRAATGDLAVIARHQNLVERKGLTGLGGKTFNLEGIARGHPILFSTCLYYCVHKSVKKRREETRFQS